VNMNTDYEDPVQARFDALQAELNQAMSSEGQKDLRIDDLEHALWKFGAHRGACPAWGRPRPDLCTCGFVAAFGGVKAFTGAVPSFEFDGLGVK
jgi:hypothetical protein